ncbi:hypothetical protein ACJXDE_05555 [Enterococcus faecium]|uniref:hypothetical protein n=1 Tax=Enterococcus faecium TaxID=1352 RepID=UPI0038D42E1C
MGQKLIQLVGKFHCENLSILSGREIEEFWCLLCVQYTANLERDSLVCYAKKIRVRQVALLQYWLEGVTKEKFEKIRLVNMETGEKLFYTKKSLDGYYYHAVYCQVKEMLAEFVRMRVNDFYYFYFTLKKQGWDMSIRFVKSILNEGVFLTREKDPTKRIPYNFMDKLDIRMG